MLAMAEIAVGLAMAQDPSVSVFEAHSFDSGVGVKGEHDDGRPLGVVRHRRPPPPAATHPRCVEIPWIPCC